MFNLKKQQSLQSDKDAIDSFNLRKLLKQELLFCDIKHKSGKYEIGIGDESLIANTAKECKEHIEIGINELKNALFDLWQQLAVLCENITKQDGKNQGCLDNIIFLRNIKQSFLLSTMFGQLAQVSASIKQIFNMDIAKINQEHVKEYNSLYMKIQLVHFMIMSEKYRLMVLDKYSSFSKEAQISGPWANLDLAEEERHWPYSEDEEWFGDREKSRKSQARYNPEEIDGAGSHGYYFIWQDLTRDPYKFEDMQTDSPYKSRSILTVASNEEKHDLIIKKTIAEDVISKLEQFCSRHSISYLFVVGSYCNATYMNVPWTSNTIEITSTLYDDPKYIGFLFSTEILQASPVYFEEKKLVSVSYKDIIIEFQGPSIKSYMNNREVVEWMKSANIEDVPMLHNVYGRDFTINTLALSIDNGNMYDPTGKATKDIERELISSILPPSILIKNNPRAILDAIKLSLSSDFYIENSLSLVMKEGSKLISESLSDERIIKHVVDILKIDATKGLDMLKRYHLDPILLHPSIKELVYNAKHSQ